uniref:Secreted protein n=1 Tax=Panagrellus redivivus TaxID=6233 RepID=A0A7E4W761_PANRE
MQLFISEAFFFSDFFLMPLLLVNLLLVMILLDGHLLVILLLDGLLRIELVVVTSEDLGGITEVGDGGDLHTPTPSLFRSTILFPQQQCTDVRSGITG